MSNTQNNKQIPEKILKENIIYDGFVLRLSVYDIELPSGKKSEREVVSHKGAIAIVPLTPENDVILIKQFRSATREFMIEIPAGILEPHEDPIEGAQRELREETGYSTDTITPIQGIHPTPGYSNEYIHLFLAQDLKIDPLPQDDEEDIEIVQLPLEDAIQQIIQGDITDAKTVSGLFRAWHQIQS